MIEPCDLMPGAEILLKFETRHRGDTVGRAGAAEEAGEYEHYRNARSGRLESRHRPSKVSQTGLEFQMPCVTTRNRHWSRSAM